MSLREADCEGDVVPGQFRQARRGDDPDRVADSQPGSEERGLARLGLGAFDEEDEEALRGLIERILGAAGYQTLILASAPEALAALEHEKRPVDLLLTDVMLPGALQGHDLARTVLASRPHLPVLYISGYSRNALVHAGRLDEGVNLLEKPFTPKSLVNKVRKVLDLPRGSG